MELRGLRYFVAVAEELSFSRAAARLNMSQPPLSRQIRNLEEELNVQLLERNKRRVRLTNTGVLFLEHARRTLDQAERAALIARKATHGEVGHISMAFLPYADLTVLPKLLPKLAADYPDIQLELRTLSGARQVEALRAGTIDVGFIHLPVAGEEFAVERVLRHPYVLVLPSEHPFMRRRSISLSALAHERYVFFPRRNDPSLYDSVIGFCLGAGVVLNVVYETDHMQTTLGLIAAGLGVALLPSAIMSIKRPGVAYLPIRPANAWYEMHVVYRRDNRSPTLGALLRTLSKCRFAL